jgi:hypothetical protein
MLCRRRHKAHKVVNVLSALPKSAHPGAKAALAEIYKSRTATTPSGPPRRSKALRREVAHGCRESHRRP